MPLEPTSQASQASREPSGGLEAVPADRVGDLGVTVQVSSSEAAVLSGDELIRVGPSNFDRTRLPG
ncbi:MAG: hypothetical protein ABI338_05045 [Gemmatimonadaceae bacterium]